MQSDPAAQSDGEQVFADWPGVETASAGVNNDAENPVTPELLEWRKRSS